MKNVIKQYKLGFSIYGLIAFALQELPYLPWMLWPPRDNPLAGNVATYPWLEIAEKVGGILTIAFLCLIIRKDAAKPRTKDRFCVFATISLAGYYASWAAYFAGFTNGWLLVIGMSAIVPVYYLFIALWLKNRMAIMPCALFFAAHTLTNTINFML